MSFASRFAGSLAYVWLAVFASAGMAAADTILVTGGGLHMTGTVGRLSITGSDGFSLSAGVDAASGVYAPFDCFVPACGPGSTIDLHAFWSDNDLPGTATLGGTTYSRLGDLNGIASATVEFTGRAVAPPLGSASSAVITVPFALGGFFIQPVGESQGVLHDLAGSGTATLWLEKNVDGATWRPDRVSYDFGSVPAQPVPTPEPASLVLVATGLGLAVSRRLRGRHP